LNRKNYGAVTPLLVVRDIRHAVQSRRRSGRFEVH
jgi:hypothetical protein